MSEENKETKDMKQCSIDLVKKYPHAVVIVLLIIAFLLGTAVGGAGHRGGKYRGDMDRGGMQRNADQQDWKDRGAEAVMPAPQQALPETPTTPTDMPTPPETPVTGTGTN